MFNNPMLINVCFCGFWDKVRWVGKGVFQLELHQKLYK